VSSPQWLSQLEFLSLAVGELGQRVHEMHLARPLVGCDHLAAMRDCVLGGHIMAGSSDRKSNHRFPPARIGRTDDRRLAIDGMDVPYIDQLIWAGLATSPGLPATAVPIGLSPDGLPIGVQIVGPFLEDRTPLTLAALIEREFGGFKTPPGFG